MYGEQDHVVRWIATILITLAACSSCGSDGAAQSAVSDQESGSDSATEMTAASSGTEGPGDTSESSAGSADEASSSAEASSTTSSDASQDSATSQDGDAGSVSGLASASEPDTAANEAAGTDSATDDGSTGTETSSMETADSAAAPETAQDDSAALDVAGSMRYANVTAVATSGSEGSYNFNVSVESSDVDCSQFADWWEVLSEDGALIFRRILEHPHTDENCTSDADAPGNTFTRGGGPVEIAADQVVYVRAHLSAGGYAGVVMQGSAADGFAVVNDLKGGFASDVEAEVPQPDGCYEPTC